MSGDDTVSDREAAESIDRERQAFIKRGLTPHVRPIVMTDRDEEWWERPEESISTGQAWAFVAGLAVVAAFLLTLLHAWPF